MFDDRAVLTERMADNLPVLRKKLRMTQEELALMIGSSRYTVMLYETKKRRMPWNVFLSLVFLFDKNPETAPLLRVLEIYSEELDSFVRHERGDKMSL